MSHLNILSQFPNLKAAEKLGDVIHTPRVTYRLERKLE